jgi:N-acetyl sugar amidotransferase
MTKLQYCTRCLYPATKPRLTFDGNGVCSACTAFDERSAIDWEARKEAFRELCKAAKAAAEHRPYDCIVPVSGGKDSHYQVIKVLEYGLRPLAVTAMTDHLTEVGARNLANISKLGVDHVMIQTDQELRRKLNRFCLETIGDISWPEHATIFSVPIREAAIRGIPLVVYGENPENEYGGPRDAQNCHFMDTNWLHEFGGLCGLRVTDIIDRGLATKRQMFHYSPPKLGDNSLLKACFLGQYFPWDGKANVAVAEQYGFDPWGRPAGSWLEGENIDNAQTGIHDFLMYLKFGYGRASAQLSQEVRRGRMSRADAVDTAREYDGVFPWRYVDKWLREVLEPLNMSRRDLWEVMDKFANRDLFEVYTSTRELNRKFKLE